jgi:hypothetical protein
LIDMVAEHSGQDLVGTRSARRRVIELRVRGRSGRECAVRDGQIDQLLGALGAGAQVASHGDGLVPTEFPGEEAEQVERTVV